MAKQKKKFPWGMVIYFVSCMAVGAAAGILLAKNDVDFALADVLAAFVLFLVVFYLHTILHEVGHLLCGLITGYGFVSFRIGSIMWEKGADGRVRRCRYALAGTGGQCLMSPPEYNGGSYPYVWYNLGGVLVNFLLAALSGLVLWLCPAGGLVSVALWLNVGIGALLGIINLLPFIGTNDGSNLLAISRSESARRAFWLQVKINQQISLGVRLKDMPEEYFPAFPEADRKNAMVMALTSLSASRQLDALHLAQARQQMLALMDDPATPDIYRKVMTFDLAWMEMVSGQPGDMAERIKASDMKQFAKAMGNNPSILRTQYAQALLLDKDEKKAQTILAAFEKAAKRYPHPCEIAGERELLALTDNPEKYREMTCEEADA